MARQVAASANFTAFQNFFLEQSLAVVGREQIPLLLRRVDVGSDIKSCVFCACCFVCNTKQAIEAGQSATTTSGWVI